jgi:hypothetical protein
MFDLWRVKRKKRKAEREFHAAFEKLKADKKSDQQTFAEHSAEEYYELKSFDEWIDVILSDRLTEKARELDVEMPSYDDKLYWQKFEDSDMPYLTSHGRSHVRKLVDEEKTRRFEVTTRWFKLIAMLAPVLGAAAGVIGAMIGWVAIHKK